jgi:hypothetical protein
MSELEIKAVVRERDGHRCVDCGETQQRFLARYGRALDVHRMIPGSDYSIEACVTLCRLCHRRRHSIGPSVCVDIHGSIVQKVRVISARRKISMGKYLSDLLRPLVNRDYSKMAKEISSEEGQD